MKMEPVTLLVLMTVVIGIAAAMLAKVRHVFVVPDGHAGLLFDEGLFIETLKAGRNVRWGLRLTANIVDFRKTNLTIAGQEVLTADNIGIKTSLLVSFQMTDPAKAVNETQSWQNDLHTSAQIALRAVIGSAAVEGLLTRRFDVGAQLLARVQPDAAKIGIHVLAVEVKDVIFPAELKRAFTEVVKAKQEGQAALERARGESAALRNLANAARVLDGNPALLNLRLMQSIASAQNAGNTLVLGMQNGFVPLAKKKRDGTPNNEDGGA